MFFGNEYESALMLWIYSPNFRSGAQDLLSFLARCWLEQTGIWGLWWGGGRLKEWLQNFVCIQSVLLGSPTSTLSFFGTSWKQIEKTYIIEACFSSGRRELFMQASWKSAKWKSCLTQSATKMSWSECRVMTSPSHIWSGQPFGAYEISLASNMRQKACRLLFSETFQSRHQYDAHLKSSSRDLTSNTLSVHMDTWDLRGL